MGGHGWWSYDVGGIDDVAKGQVRFDACCPTSPRHPLPDTSASTVVNYTLKRSVFLLSSFFSSKCLPYSPRVNQSHPFRILLPLSLVIS